MKKDQIERQKATLAAIKTAFNISIAPEANIAVDTLNTTRTAFDSPQLAAASAKFAAVIAALNDAVPVMRSAIAETEALVADPVPVPPPVIVPIVVTQPVVLGAKNQRTGQFFEGNGGPAAALLSAAPGDTVLVAPGRYVGLTVTINNPITIDTLVPGQKYTFDMGGPRDASIIQFGSSLNISNAELCDNIMEYSIAAGLWPTGDGYTLKVSKCELHGLSNGIITGEHRNAIITIEDSLFYDCGDYSYNGHPVYIGGIKMLTFRRNTSTTRKIRGTPGVSNFEISAGHLFKCRAQEALIEDCTFVMGLGSEANRCMDFPNGGLVTVRRCLLGYRTTQNGGSSQLVSFGVENDAINIGLTQHSLTIEDSTLVNMGPGAANTLWRRFAEGPQSIQGNIFSGIGQPSVKGDARWAIDPAQNRIVPLSAFKNLNAFDATLLPEPWELPPLTNGRAKGYIDGISPQGTIAGWAIDPQDKAALIKVSFYLDGAPGIGKLLQSNATDVSRPDVNTATGATGIHGYGFPIPNEYRDQQAHAIHVYGVDTTGALAALTNSPVSFRLGPITAAAVTWIPKRDVAGNITNFAELPDRAWTPIPGTAMESTIKPLLDAGGYTLYQVGDSGLSAVMDNYSGMAFDQAGGRMWAYGGGHFGGSDNGVYQIDLNAMKWSVTSWPSHPTKDFTPEQFAYYTRGARQGGAGTTTVHVFPLRESSTGFAIKGDQAFSSTRWFPVVGPERDVSAKFPVFENGDTWEQSASHALEYVKGSQNLTLFDGRPVSMHTYNGFVYSSSFGGPVLVTRGYWNCALDGTGWIRYPAKGAGVAPKQASGEGVWVQTDEKTGKIIWGGCGSSCWEGNYFFYSAGYVYDPVTCVDEPTGRLIPDSVYASGKMLVNAGDMMVISFKAGRKIGGLCNTGYGWTYDLDTGARQLFVMTGSPYSGATGEGRSSAYIPHLGKLWIFDTSVQSCPVWELDIDSPKPGGPNGAMTVETRQIVLGNDSALPSSGNGLTYSRLAFWEKQKMLVYFPGTKQETWACRIA